METNLSNLYVDVPCLKHARTKHWTKQVRCTFRLLILAPFEMWKPRINGLFPPSRLVGQLTHALPGRQLESVDLADQYNCTS